MPIFDLTDQPVKQTYMGVLHAQGEMVPAAGLVPVYDGVGQQTSLEVGLSGNGAAVNGGLSISQALSAGELVYTTQDSVSGNNFPLVSLGSGRVGFGQITSNALLDLTPSPATTVSSIEQITVNSKGLVTRLVGNNNPNSTALAWVKFDGTDITGVSYTISSTVITCTRLLGVNVIPGQFVTIKNATNAQLNGTYVVQTVPSSSQFTIANPYPASIVTGTGTLTIDMIVKSSYNVNKVERIGTKVGHYRITFTKSFNNSNYTVVCGSTYPGYNLSDIENLQANCIGTANGYVDVRAFYVSPTNSVTEYDDGVISVVCTGNLQEQGDVNPPINFSNYIWDGRCAGEPATIDTTTLTYNITPEFMTTNRFNAIIIGAESTMNCRSGGSSVDLINTINGNQVSRIAWNSGGNSGQAVYAYCVFLYANNNLYYGNFWWTNGGATAIPTNGYSYDRNDEAAAQSIFSGLLACGIVPNWGVSLNNTASCSNSWLTNFVNTYAANMSVINSASLSHTIYGARGGPCYGGFNMVHSYVRYFTPQ